MDAFCHPCLEINENTIQYDIEAHLFQVHLSIQVVAKLDVLIPL